MMVAKPIPCFVRDARIARWLLSNPVAARSTQCIMLGFNGSGRLGEPWPVIPDDPEVQLERGYP